MASAELIVEWKKKYGEVYSVASRGQEYIFRALTFSEHDDLTRQARYISTADQEDFVVKIALLYPDASIDTMIPGVVSYLAESILEFSGFGSPKQAKTILEKHKEQANGVRSVMYAFVIDAMPAYKTEDLDQLTYSDLTMKVAIAEKIIELRQSYANPESVVSFELVDLEEQRKEEEERARKAAEKAKKAATRINKDPDAAPIKPTIKAQDPIAQKLKAALG